MILSKNQILSSRKTHAVRVEAWGGEVLLKPLSVADLGKFLDCKQEMDGPESLAFLVFLSVCDEDGNRLFDGNEELEDQPFEAIKFVADEVLKLNKIGEDAGPKD